MGDLGGGSDLLFYPPIPNFSNTDRVDTTWRSSPNAFGLTPSANATNCGKCNTGKGLVAQYALALRPCNLIGVGIHLLRGNAH
jgi:hypothetical protein